MPLIALDILEGKIKELTLIIRELSEENRELKEKISAAPKAGQQQEGLSPETLYELEKLKKLAEKYKNERTELYSKISGAIKKIDSLVGKGQNG